MILDAYGLLRLAATGQPEPPLSTSRRCGRSRSPKTRSVVTRFTPTRLLLLGWLDAGVLPGLQRPDAAAQRHHHSQRAARVRECGPTFSPVGPLREHQRTPVLGVDDAQSADCMYERTLASPRLTNTHQTPHRATSTSHHLHDAGHHRDAMNSSIGIAAHDW